MTATSLDHYCSTFYAGIFTGTERILCVVTKWESNFYKCTLALMVHDNEECGCATTEFALGLVLPAHTQTLLCVTILNSAYSFFSTFVF